MSAFSFPPNSAAWAAARTLCDAVVEPRRTREVGSAREKSNENQCQFRLWDGQCKWVWPSTCPQGTLEGWKEELQECEEGVSGIICDQKNVQIFKVKNIKI